MQKRRPIHASSSSDGSLPLTVADPASNGLRTRGTYMQKKSRKKYQSSSVMILIGCFLCTGILALWIFQSSSPSSSAYHKHFKNADIAQHKQQRRLDHHASISTAMELPLTRYSALKYSLENARLVGVYFAAAWCPMSTPVTKRINEYLGPRLLPPSSSLENAAEESSQEKQDMALVYVSSDRSEQDFMGYLGTHWNVVPFDDTDQRTSLKQHFRVCAKPEQKALRVDRQHGIPTLLILDAATQQVLTKHGAEDLEEHQDHAIQYWLDLRRLAHRGSVTTIETH